MVEQTPPQTIVINGSLLLRRGGDFSYSTKSTTPTQFDATSSTVNNGSMEGLHSDYECCICFAPAFEPVQHESCGQMYCQKCVEPLNACPTCRAAPLVTKPVTLKIVLNKLNALLVVCPSCNSSNVLRREFAQHIAACAVACSQGCGVRVAPRDKSIHEQRDCANTIVYCSARELLCPWSGERRLLAAHNSECHYVALSPVLSHLVAETTALKQQTRELQRQTRELQRELIAMKEKRRRDNTSSSTTTSSTVAAVSTTSISTATTKNLSKPSTSNATTATTAVRYRPAARLLIAQRRAAKKTK